MGYEAKITINGIPIGLILAHFYAEKHLIEFAKQHIDEGGRKALDLFDEDRSKEISFDLRIDKWSQ